MFSLKKVVPAVFVAIVMAAAAVWYIASPSSAATDKVYVCKYVGTPGVDEVLKAGKNPIEVAVSSIQQNQWNGQVPGYFSDAHDRSFVLGYVGEIPEPSSSDCPGGDNPPDEQIQVPDVDPEDPCGPDNAYWEAPADDDTFDWTLSEGDRRLEVLIIKDGVTFFGGSKYHDYGIAVDLEDPCVEPDEEITVPTVPVNDPCGPDNAVYGSVPSGNYSVDRNSDGSITLTANEGYVFPDEQETYTFPAPVDSGKLCDDGEIGPAGFVNVTTACESITIGTPTVSPDGVGWDIELDGKSVRPGTHKVAPGLHTVVLTLEGNLGSPFAERVQVKACSGNNGGNTGGQGNGLNNPAVAHTGR